MDLLKKLIVAHGVSGDEDEVRKIILREIKPHVDEVIVDKLGNLIAVRKGKKPSVMLAAHMDEVGLMVAAIDENGLISVEPVGDITPTAVLGEEVALRTKKGIIHGWLTTRDLSASITPKALPVIEDLIVDTGLTKKELAEWDVRVGTHVSFDKKASYTTYGKKIAGKALDDRIGCYILIELAKALKKGVHETYFVFTVQEEFGLYGAKTSMHTLDPDWGIAVDVVSATDLLQDDPNKILIGGGPVLTPMDDRLIASKELNDHLLMLGKKLGIPMQLEVTLKGTTDASVISLSRGGVPAAVVAVPMRNMHTTAGIAHKRDIQQAIKLLGAFLTEPLPSGPK